MFLGLEAYPYRATYNVQTWVGNLVMLQDYPVFQVLRRFSMPEQGWFIQTFGSARPFWTVAVEWWLYLFFGYLAFCRWTKGGLTLRAGVILAVFGVVPVYNLMGGIGHCLTFVWLIGVLFAFGQRRLESAVADFTARQMQRYALLSGAAAGFSLLLLIGFIFARGFMVYDLQFAIFTAGILFGIFFALGFCPVARPSLIGQAINFMADYSYSLYLIHFTIIVAFVLLRGSHELYDPKGFVLLITIANAAAILFWFAFERHYRSLARLAKRFLNRRAAPKTARA
jgi:peptidoglycan/LPS O-acetylase OafA/YrhL